MKKNGSMHSKQDAKRRGNISENGPTEIETVKARLDFKKYVKDGEYIDLDIYGRGDRRVLGEIKNVGEQPKITRRMDKSSKARKPQKGRSTPMNIVTRKMRRICRKLSVKLDFSGKHRRRAARIVSLKVEGSFDRSTLQRNVTDHGPPAQEKQDLRENQSMPGQPGGKDRSGTIIANKTQLGRVHRSLLKRLSGHARRMKTLVESRRRVTTVIDDNKVKSSNRSEAHNGNVAPKAAKEGTEWLANERIGPYRPTLKQLLHRYLAKRGIVKPLKMRVKARNGAKMCEQC